MPGTGSGSGQWVTVGDDKHELIYSMLSLEKIETQFGSVAEMQNMITDDNGQVMLDRPVVKLLIDIIHAGLLHDYEDSPAGRKAIATGIRPADLDAVVTAFTVAFTDSFGELGEKAMAGEAGGPVMPNRATRRSASRSPAGTTSQPSSSAGRKKSGKK